MGGEHRLDGQSVVNNDVLEHLEVETDVKRAGTHVSDLSKENVLGHTPAIVHVSHSGSLHQDLNGLLEGASRESTGVGSIDTVSGDRHEPTSLSHEVAQKR